VSVSAKSTKLTGLRSISSSLPLRFITSTGQRCFSVSNSPITIPLQPLISGRETIPCSCTRQPSAKLCCCSVTKDSIMGSIVSNSVTVMQGNIDTPSLLDDEIKPSCGILAALNQAQKGVEWMSCCRWWHACLLAVDVMSQQWMVRLSHRARASYCFSVLNLVYVGHSVSPDRTPLRTPELAFQSGVLNYYSNWLHERSAYAA
jgi:hypothetical protein